MRQLKRNITVMECDNAGGRAAAERAAAAVSTPVPDMDIDMDGFSAMPAPRPLPQLPPLPRGTGKDHDYGSMEPPRQPQQKRASFEIDAQVAAVPTPQRLFSSPRRAAARAFDTPQRLLTPRISWSDIISHSQDGTGEASNSQRQAAQGSPPRTPVFLGRRQASSFGASPPQRRGSVRRRPPTEEDEEESPASRDQNEGRLEREFCGVTVIGRGQFSTVYRVQNRIDQCMYAVKKTTQITRGLRCTQLREVFALANVSMEAEGCPNIVRYYSSWVEDGRLHIQTELCECSLRDRLHQKRREEPSNARFSETEITQVVRDVANGLKVLHTLEFVHLDIKPDNILVSRHKREDGRPLYKIADLGLAAAAIGSGCDDISEGDCRYLAKEVLRGNLAELPKADVFALGLVSYELATSPKPLPCNGDEWQLIREGCLDLDLLAHLSESLVELTRGMAAALAADRPPCEEILRHPCVQEGDAQDKEQLRRRLEDSEAAARKAGADAKAAAEQAEHNRQLADEYLHEILQMKKQELLSSGAPGRPFPSTGAPAAGAAPSASRSGAAGGPHGQMAAPALPQGAKHGLIRNHPPVLVLRRGKTS